MQPLTPAERREIEVLRQDIIAIRQNLDSHSIMFSPKNKELWLKVLTMALECNEALETSWKRSYKAHRQAYDDDFDDAKRRLGR